MRLIVHGDKKFCDAEWERTEIEISIDDCETIHLEIVTTGFAIRISKATLDWALKTYIEGYEFDEST